MSPGDREIHFASHRGLGLFPLLTREPPPIHGSLFLRLALGPERFGVLAGNNSYETRNPGLLQPQTATPAVRIFADADSRAFRQSPPQHFEPQSFGQGTGRSGDAQRDCGQAERLACLPQFRGPCACARRAWQASARAPFRPKP